MRRGRVKEYAGLVFKDVSLMSRTPVARHEKNMQVFPRGPNGRPIAALAPFRHFDSARESCKPSQSALFNVQNSTSSREEASIEDPSKLKR